MASLPADIEVTPKFAPQMHPLALHHNTAEHPPGFPHSMVVLLLSPQMRSTIYFWHSASAGPLFDIRGPFRREIFWISFSMACSSKAKLGLPSRFSRRGASDLHHYRFSIEGGW
jgi:hypothetical protein